MKGDSTIFSPWKPKSKTTVSSKANIIIGLKFWLKLIILTSSLDKINCLIKYPNIKGTTTYKTTEIINVFQGTLISVTPK